MSSLLVLCVVVLGYFGSSCWVFVESTCGILYRSCVCVYHLYLLLQPLVDTCVFDLGLLWSVFWDIWDTSAPSCLFWNFAFQLLPAWGCMRAEHLYDALASVAWYIWMVRLSYLFVMCICFSCMSFSFVVCIWHVREQGRQGGRGVSEAGLCSRWNEAAFNDGEQTDRCESATFIPTLAPHAHLGQHVTMSSCGSG